MDYCPELCAVVPWCEAEEFFSQRTRRAQRALGEVRLLGGLGALGVRTLWIGQSRRPAASQMTKPAVATTFRSSTEIPAKTAPRATWAAWSARCKRRLSVA